MRAFHFVPVAYELTWRDGCLPGFSSLAGGGVPVRIQTMPGVERGQVQLLRLHREGRAIDYLWAFSGVE